MSEYYMTHTGIELDDAINKVKSGYILPSETINIIENISNMDITKGKMLNVNVPVPDGYVLPTEIINIASNVSNMDITNGKTLNVNVPIKHFATGVVNNVTAGQQLSVTGIKDSVTGEAFEVKGVICFMHPASATNYQSSGNKPAVAAFYMDKDINGSVAIAAYNLAYSVRVHPTAISNYLSISENSFVYQSMPASMYGVLAATRWRWVAWG